MGVKDITSVFKKSGGKSKLMFGFVAVISVAMVGLGLSGGNSIEDIGGSATDQGARKINKISPVGDNVTAEYAKLAKEANEKRISEAAKSGGSAIPTLSSLDDIILKQEEDKKEAVKKEPVKVKEVSVKKVQEHGLTINPVYKDIYDEQEKLVSSAFLNLSASFERSYHSVDEFASAGGLVGKGGALGENAMLSNDNKNTKSGVDGNSNNPMSKENMTQGKSKSFKIPVGTIIPAVTLTEANSDEKGPLRAKIVGGKLDGAILVGEFTVNKKSISMSYKALTKDGKVAKINAFAVDPSTSRTALATDVNHHYMYRYGMLLSSSFLTGISTAISSAGTTVTNTVTGPVQNTPPIISINKQLWAGAGRVGQEVSRIAKDEFNTPTTITVSSGQLIGVLFVDSANDSWLPQFKAEEY